jgi:hypothetical protein
MGNDGIQRHTRRSGGWHMSSGPWASVVEVTIAVAVAVVLLASPASAAVAKRAPYVDASAVGSIGLCDRAGHQITSGSIDADPMAAYAVSTVPAPKPYNNSWRTAVLMAYQPWNGLLASMWSGEELTSSSRYTNPAHPMAAITPGDGPLRWFLQDYPTKWDGFVQLRMYLGTADAPIYSLHYPTLNLQITGTTWRAVGGATVNCKVGSSVSLESIVLQHAGSSPTTAAKPGGASNAKPAIAIGVQPGVPSALLFVLIVGVAGVLGLAVLAARHRVARNARRSASITSN